MSEDGERATDDAKYGRRWRRCTDGARGKKALREHQALVLEPAT
jgi:hypothetical protein